MNVNNQIMKKIKRIRRKNRNKLLKPKDFEIDMRKSYLSIREKEKTKEALQISEVATQILRLQFLIKTNSIIFAWEQKKCQKKVQLYDSATNMHLPACIFCDNFQNCIVPRIFALKYNQTFGKYPDKRVLTDLKRRARDQYIRWFKMFHFEVCCFISENNLYDFPFENYVLKFYFRK